MSIVFNCQCGQQLATDLTSAGQQVQCPHCHSILVVPNPVAPASPPSSQSQPLHPQPPQPQPPQPQPPQPQPPQPQPPQPQPPQPLGQNPYDQVNVPAQPKPSPPKPTPQPVPQQNQFVQSPMQPMMQPLMQGAGQMMSAPPPGAGRRPVNGMGIAAGIAGIVFGILHLGCGGILGVVAAFVRDVQGMAQAPTQMTGSGEYNGVVNKYFGYVNMSLGLMIFVLMSYSAALIVGAIGLFKGKLWGFIISNITAAIAVLIAIFLFWGYMKALTGMEVIDKTVDHVANQTEMDQKQAQFAKDVNQMQRTQVHWSAWFVIAFYGGYAALVGICLLNPNTFRDYRS